MTNSKVPVLFLDRDGTINVDKGYINSMDALEFIPGAIEALQLAHNSGYKLALITNQAGVAKGLTPAHMPLKIAHHIEEKAGIKFSDIRICPHKPEDACQCRKPGTLNLQRAAQHLNADLAQSWFIGDTDRDVECAFSYGVRPILLLTGHGTLTAESYASKPQIKQPQVCADLLTAVRWVLSHRT